MKGPLAVCCWDGRGPVFRRGGGRGEGLRTASTALWRAVLLGNVTGHPKFHPGLFMNLRVEGKVGG